VKLRKAHPKLPFIIGGDGLFSKQPFINTCKQQGMSFILVAKPAGHKVLFEYVEEIAAMGAVDTVELVDIENEAFNTIKNQGYHIEHTFGHGKKHLSMVFFLLNFLAFYLHQILDLTDRCYQRLRYEKFTRCKEFWNQLRCTFRILLFSNWEHMFEYLLDPPPLQPP